MSKVNYIYAELSADSIDKLKLLFPFKFDKQFGTYITLDWKVSSNQYSDILGKSYKLAIDTLAYDNFAEAIRVDLENSDLRSVNKNPHITWSVSEDFDPYYCNYMLEVTANKKQFDPIEIEVTVEDSLF